MISLWGYIPVVYGAALCLFSRVDCLEASSALLKPSINQCFEGRFVRQLPAARVSRAQGRKPAFRVDCEER
jgi:hypothetical protein